MDTIIAIQDRQGRTLIENINYPADSLPGAVVDAAKEAAGYTADTDCGLCGLQAVYVSGGVYGL